MINNLPKSLIEAAKRILTESQTHIEVDGEMKHRYNSEGKLIHPTEEGIRNFHRWFGDSKAVDAQGRPQVVYHGTSHDFDTFDKEKIGTGYNRFGAGFYFTGDKKTFDVYSSGEGGNVKPVYLSIKSPQVSSAMSHDQIHNFFSALQDKKFANGYDATEDHERIKQHTLSYPEHAFEHLASNNGIYISNGDWFRGMKAAGIDGVIQNVFKHPEYVVHSPSQIKSAIGNNGDFNPTKDAIHESVEHPMIEVDGVMKHRHNSLGQPIHSDEEGIRNFHRWFGDSKAVDDHGRPQVFYHGTGANIKKFDVNKIGLNWKQDTTGFFFTTHYKTADFNAIKAGKRFKASGPNVIPTYIHISNPLHVNTKYNLDANNYYDTFRNEILNNAKVGNHDGIIINDGNHKQIVAFQPSQIKSAIGNSGDFDPTKDAIHESYSDPIKTFRDKWNAAGVDNFVHHNEDRNQISLSSIIVPKHKQRQGIGSQYMTDLKNYADKHGATITLTPSTDFGGSKTGLLRFYKSHGFVENKGRNKDYTISNTMYRRPEKYIESEEITPEKIESDKKPTPKPVKDTTMSRYLKPKEFHDWFGDSQIKSPMGDPIVAYHGTPDIRGIEESGEFNNSKNGIFFTNDFSTANSYAKDVRASDYQNAKPGIIAAHLKITNPYIHDHGGKEWFGTDKVIADAKEKGHDGVVIKNVVDHYNTNRVKTVKPSTVYVVFDNKQIKHATLNSGSHDQSSNIYK